MQQIENKLKTISPYLLKNGPKWLWAEMVWAEMVMGRNGHGPKWLWAEMTRNLIFILSLNQVRLLPFCYISAKISILMYLLEYSSILTDAANEVGFIKKIVSKPVKKYNLKKKTHSEMSELS